MNGGGRERGEHADERTIRRAEEERLGGMSSDESDARYRAGENPGGLHGGAVRREGPEHERPGQDEPQGRRERRPRGPRRHLPGRRGGW